MQETRYVYTYRDVRVSCDQCLDQSTVLCVNHHSPQLVGIGVSQGGTVVSGAHTYGTYASYMMCMYLVPECTPVSYLSVSFGRRQELGKIEPTAAAEGHRRVDPLM